MCSSSDVFSLYKTILSAQVYSLGPHPTKVLFSPTETGSFRSVLSNPGFADNHTGSTAAPRGEP